MKISAKLTKALNSQISLEAYASSYYLSMASWCKIKGYEGSAKFLSAQADEERQHMLKIVTFLDDIGIGADIPSVKQPPKKFKSLEDIFRVALKNEQAVTSSINRLVDIAQKERAHNAFTLLQWFVDEQIQEETTFETILQKFVVAGRDRLAVYELDRDIGAMAPQAE